MKIFKLLLLAGLTVIATPSFAEEGHMYGHSGMQMDSSMDMSMMGEKECDQMGGMKHDKMDGMKNMMEMRRQHMQTMEDRMANIEKLLQQLVELQKQNGLAK